MAVVTLASEGGDKGGASPRIVTVACRKDAQFNLQRAVSEEGLPSIEDLDDKDRGNRGCRQRRAKREDLHTSVMGDGVECADAIQVNTIISTFEDVAVATSDESRLTWYAKYAIRGARNATRTAWGIGEVPKWGGTRV